VVRAAKRLDLIAIPGVATASEAFAMIEAGADALKVFPADVVGPRLVTGLRAVMPPGTIFVPVGGVDATTIPIWLKAGAKGLGVGSALYKPGELSGETLKKARLLLESTRTSG
jgi:2-dehydro-3-deoxyphosphogalactonate aldolase